MFLFDGFLMVYKMYVHVTKHGIWVCPRRMWLSMGIDVRLQWASVGWVTHLVSISWSYVSTKGVHF